MRAISTSVIVFFAALSAPCFAQSLEVKDGSPVSIEKLAVEAKVEEGFALVSLDETFRSAADRPSEGVWKFRLPADAVVCSFSMWMNGREKTGRVLEATAARAVYDSIVRKKLDPGLVEQTGWRDFKVSVFPIPPHDTVRIRLRYAYALPDDLGLETLEVPLPVGCGAVGDLSVMATFAAARGLAALDCPSHRDAKLLWGDGLAEATWSGDGVRPTGAFVLRAVPVRDGFDVAVLVHRPAGSDEGFFVARVVPRLAAPPAIPRDVAFVFDRSGSMEGAKIEQARAALLRGVDSLKPGDRFNVVSFSSDVTSMTGAALFPAAAPSLERARRAARDLSASGGTNIAGALNAALALRSNDPSRLFAVVFLTDGDPTVGELNPERILAAWRAKSAGAARLFAFGVGGDVKDFLLTKLAAEGRGAATYVGRDDELEVKVSALVDAVRTPLLLDPEISIEGADVQVLDREPRRVPDVFQGRALVVAGRFRGAGKAVLHLRGRFGADALDVPVPVDFSAPADRPHVAQIWAKTRIERLLDDLRAGGANAEIKAEIVRLGVRHQIVSPYTSFLVVEDGVHVADPSETARVPGGDNPGGPTTGGPPASGGGGGAPSTGGDPHENREPSDPPPPPESGGPQTPGGPDAGGPTTPAGGPSSGGGGGGGASTGGKSGASPTKARGFEDWTWWWRYSWRDFLAADSTPRVVASPSTLDLLRSQARSVDESFHVVSKAVLSLGAIGDEESVAELLAAASEPAPSALRHRATLEAAMLALGLLPKKSAEVREFLLRSVRAPGDRSFRRAFAAVALGLRPEGGEADAEATRVLFDVLADATSDADVRAACLLSIGRLGGADAGKRLLPLLRGREEDRPFVVEALGRCGRAEDVAGALTAAFPRDRYGVNASRSAPTALARLAAGATAATRGRIVAALAQVLRDHDDARTQGRAALALGRIVADAATDADARRRASSALSEYAAKGRSPLARAYALLGLGVACRAAKGVVPAQDLAEFRRALRGAATSQRDDECRAGLLADGLSGDASGLAVLRATVADAGESSSVRDMAGVAAALVDPASAREAVERGVGDGAARIFAAQAACAWPDPAFVPALLVQLKDRDASIDDQRALVRALARCGGAATVDALRAVAVDAQHVAPDFARACAVEAIGRLCGDFSPFDAYVEDVNFRAYVPAIAELMSLR